MTSGAIFAPNRTLRRAIALPVLSTVSRKERAIALARLGLGSALLVACLVAPGFFRSGLLLLGIYWLYTLGAGVAVWLARASAGELALPLHIIDVGWPLAIYLVARAPEGVALVLLILLAPLAAAYRWGFWETTATALVASALLVADVPLRRMLRASSSGSAALRFHLGSAAAEAIALMFVVALLSYLIERTRRSALRHLAVRMVLPEAWGQADLRSSLSQVSAAILNHFGAGRLVVALRETGAGDVYLWECADGNSRASAVREISPLAPPGGDSYFFSFPSTAWRFPACRYFGRPFESHAGREVIWSPPETFRRQHDFRTVFAVSFCGADEWRGNLFLFDPAPRLHPDSELRLLASVVNDLAPIFAGGYRLQRLRAKARAAERRHIARELHDGLLQSLSGLELRLEHLHRHAAEGGAGLADEIAEVQEVMRAGISDVREMMQGLKFRDLHPADLLTSLADLVERFQRETGIRAAFAPEVAEVKLPGDVCRELALIVLEGLSNVRKHSEARTVFVRLVLDGCCYKLAIADDGRGFGFAGRFTAAELERARKLPRVLDERVKIIRGELTIDSAPGRGSTLEVTIPAEGYGA